MGPALSERPQTKRSGIFILFAAVFILAGIWYGLYRLADLFLPLDFSQEYRQVEGYEGIIFEQNGWGKCFHRCFWGLKNIENVQAEALDSSRKEDSSIQELTGRIDTEHTIEQSVYSPDGNYILYCEIAYNYTHSGMTDDEYCYYRVYERKSGRIITVYQGYREWYRMVWL